MKYKTNFNIKIPFSDKNFQKVLNFYLFECPVEGICWRGVTFKEQGWVAHYFSTLKAEMLKRATKSLRGNYYPCKVKELDDKLPLSHEAEPPDEFCAFMKHDEKRVMESLFSAIRNALAHGSFSVRSYQKTKIYYFENYDKYLKAVIILHESTLLNWIGIFYSKPESLKIKNKM